jgi:hypothetical protein
VTRGVALVLVRGGAPPICYDPGLMPLDDRDLVARNKPAKIDHTILGEQFRERFGGAGVAEEHEIARLAASAIRP